MIATRKTLVAANSQHRPEEAWLVTGAPSSAILMLNFWVSEMVADREDKTALAGFELRAARARRFFQHLLVGYQMPYKVTYFGIFHELLLPLLHRRSRHILLMPGDGCVFRSF
jgi:hypothetical protein